MEPLTDIIPERLMYHSYEYVSILVIPLYFRPTDLERVILEAIIFNGSTDVFYSLENEVEYIIEMLDRLGIKVTEEEVMKKGISIVELVTNLELEDGYYGISKWYETKFILEMFMVYTS